MENEIEELKKENEELKEEIIKLKEFNKYLENIIKYSVDSKERHIAYNVERSRKSERGKFLQLLTDLSIAGKIEMKTINLDQIEKLLKEGK